VSAQIQDGSVVGVKAARTRVPDTRTTRRTLAIVAGCLVASGILAAVPATMPAAALTALFGSAWLSATLAMLLPGDAQRSAGEMARRRALFRHELNMLGDTPTTAALTAMLRRAEMLGLEHGTIGDDLDRIHAALAALTLSEQIARGELPTAETTYPIAGGDRCHFAGAARFGRRKSDHVGHLVLTGAWLQFHGALDVSVAWTLVEGVQRADGDVLITMTDSKRLLRFSCVSLRDAVGAAVIAEHLARRARMAPSATASERVIAPPAP
jgi:hypothetical protein